MKGFFNKKETESIAGSGGVIHSCASCGLYKNCKTPRMKPWGEFKKGIMIIGESPTSKDDKAGHPWADGYGRLLEYELNRLGINLFEDCVSLNAINCFPAGEFGSQEVNHCRAVIVWKAIKKYKPKMILLLGRHAVQSVVGQQWGGSAGLSEWRGFRIPDQGLKTWLCPTYSPSYLVKIEKPQQYMTIWRQDLERAFECLDQEFPVQKPPTIHFEKDCSFLNRTLPELASFDYETTGIKPHAKGHRIVCTSIADSENRAWVFPSPKSKKEWQPFRKWLHSPKHKKMAHNAKFEHSWSKNILKVTVRGWDWDSMLATHILDNRKGITSLKFQTYALLGIPDYSQDVAPYLRSEDDNGANGINTVVSLMKSTQGRKMLMKYCALDSVYQYKIAMIQKDIFNRNQPPF